MKTQHLKLTECSKSSSKEDIYSYKYIQEKVHHQQPNFTTKEPK